MTEAVIALGSNLGDRLGNLRAALRYLEEHGVRVVRGSSVLETPPVPADQPAFLNAAAVVETGLAPHELLAVLKHIERAMGRRPSRRWGPRPLDLDILFYGEQQVDTPDLCIPHPRVAERLFVLIPLAEVTQGALPVLGRTAADLAARLAAEPIRRVTGLQPFNPDSG